MSGNKSLLDTNIVLYLLGRKIESNSLPEGKFIISFINELELLSYPGISESEEEKIKSFINNIDIIELNPDLKSKTIRLRKKYNLKLPDAIICAAALLQDASLVTLDENLFKVNELKIIKPELIKNP